MKIFIYNYEFPPLGGGAGNATKNISKELVLLGHEVTVVTASFKGLKSIENIDGYNVVRLNSKRSRKDRSNILEMMSFVYKAINYSRETFKKDKPDYCIAFFALPTGLITWYIKKKFHIPYMISLRGGDVPGFLPRNLKWHHIISTPFTRLVWKSADKIVANSKGLEDLAKKTADPLNKNVLCIPNGVDTDFFSLKGDKEENSILFVGRLTEQKGVIHILNSLKEICDRRDDLRHKLSCKIVGDGPLRSELENTVSEYNLSDVVKFVGWLDKLDLLYYYQKSCIFVFPSIEEGMPNVVLEAMSCGLAVICTNIPGTDEIVQDGINGVLIDKSDELTASLSNLLDSKEICKNLGNKARESMINMGWNKIAVQYNNQLKYNEA